MNKWEEREEVHGANTLLANVHEDVTLRENDLEVDLKAEIEDTHKDERTTATTAKTAIPV